MPRRVGRTFVLVFTGLLLVAARAAAQPAEPPKVQASAFSTGRYVPGKWGVVGVQAVNDSDRDGEAFLAVYLGDDSLNQFARRMWVPARSIRRVWLPIRVSEEVAKDRDSVELTMLLLRQSAQGEVLEHKEGMELRQTVLLPIDRSRSHTATIFHRVLPNERGFVPDPDADAYEFLAVGRELVEGSRIIIDLTDDLLPSHSLMWQSIDQLFLCSDRLLDDSAGLEAVRDWLHRGGRIGIFLDRVKPETVAALLGHALRYQEVDRVELTDFTLESAVQADGRVVRDRRRFEEPVTLVRVVTDAKDIACQVNGWPAAFWQPAGRGEVLFITLGPRGWRPPPIVPGEESSEASVDPSFRRMDVLQLVADRFFKVKQADLDPFEAVQPQLQEQIGYEIPSRSLAASLLGLNLGVLFVAGWWCGRRGRLDWLAFLMPGVALVTTCVFLLIGRLNSHSVPPTVAYTQFVQIQPDTGDAHISGAAAFYQQESTPLSMTGGAGGYVRPLFQGGPGAIRRLVWADDDRGRWENVLMPAGSVRFAHFQQLTHLNSGVEAIVRFGPNGLEGRLTAPSLLPLTEALIANPPALPLSIQIREDGSFQAGQAEVLSADQYSADRILSDDTRRRQEVYRQLLDPTDALAFPSSAALIGWTSPLAAGLDWPESLRKHGVAMVSVPLRMERTAAGQPFAIPSTFIRTEAGTSNVGQSMAFNPRTGQWIKDFSLATRTRLRFCLPQQVLPCELESARLTVKLNAPSRNLEISAVVEGNEQLLQRVPNPNGVYAFQIERPEQLQLDAQGRLLFSVVVSESPEELASQQDWENMTSGKVARKPRKPTTPEEGVAGLATSFTTWQIDYLRLDVRGRTR